MIVAMAGGEGDSGAVEAKERSAVAALMANLPNSTSTPTSGTTTLTVPSQPWNSSTLPFPVRAGLKRTRSHGLAPISISGAMGGGGGGMGVGSPLKAVMTGHDSTSAPVSASTVIQNQHNEDIADNAGEKTRRAASHSPPGSGSGSEPLPREAGVPHTTPLANAKPQPRSKARAVSAIGTNGSVSASSARFPSVPEGNGASKGNGNGNGNGNRRASALAALGSNASSLIANGEEMRRVVSTGGAASSGMGAGGTGGIGAGAGAAAGRGRYGSAAPDLGSDTTGVVGGGLGRERSRREVILPARLRD